MYEAFFGLSDRPFAATARADRYIANEAMEHARETLVRCVERAEGVGVVIGPSGTGKTLLCEVVAEALREEFAVALLSSGRVSTRRALWQAILFELGQPYRGMDEGELRLALVDHIANAAKATAPLALVIDEAHTLPLRLLEELRMLTNLVVEGQPRARLILAGSARLEDRFASPKLESFSQRITARCYLQPLGRTETEEFIQAQIAAAGGEADELFAAEACQAVHTATDGVPRLVNQLCDHALVLAFTAGRNHIDRAVVEEAWSDLQQLPAPWSAEPPATTAGAGGVVEFGRLEDEAVDERHATVPLLRVAEMPDEQDIEPTERLERIERTLTTIDEFQPAGMIGPEVTLVFEDVRNPFDERFAEEEIIGARGFAPARPQELEPTPAPPGQVGPLPSQNAGQLVARQERHAAHAPARPMVAELAGRAPRTVDEPHGERSAAWCEGPQTVPLRQGEAERRGQAGTLTDEEPLIIIEDGYEEVDSPLLRRRPSVRRQEYRQLFARLRRSC